MSCTVEEVRGAELERIRPWFPAGVRVLDLGAGSGYQASLLASWGCAVEAIDIDIQPAGTSYFPVRQYDGKGLPYPDASFDRVFSSNVLEHVVDLPALLDETARVLRPGGKAIHVMPTSLWRLSSSVAHYVFVAAYVAARLRGRSMPRVSFPPPSAEDLAARKGWLNLGKRALLPGPHGEYPSAWAEVRGYTRDSWRQRFLADGFAVEHELGTGVFYAGYGVLSGLTLGHRRALGAIVGSSCNAFIVKPAVAPARSQGRVRGSRPRDTPSDRRGLRVVIAGPLPPPHGGVTGFVNLLRAHASRACESVSVFDTSSHGDVAHSGTWSMANVLRAMQLLPSMVLEARRARPSIIQIEAGGYLGLVKSAALAHAAIGVPFVLSIHSADMKGDLAQAGRTGRFLIRRALRRSGAVRVMYQAQIDQLVGLAPEVPRERYRMIRPFIEAKPRPFPEAEPDGVLRLISVGTVGLRKGTYELLRAVAAVQESGRSLHCDVFGGEERRGEMKKLTDLSTELRLDSAVTLHGTVPAVEVQRHLQQADAFVLPSRAEGLPLALMEAMSMGVPLVVTAVGAIPDTVRQPELPPFEPGDAGALEAALVRLADDPGLRARCSDANVHRTREYLSPDVVIPLYVQMWQMAADAPTPARAPRSPRKGFSPAA